MVQSKLHQAIQHGNLTQIEDLIREKVDINEKNHKGNTPLHSAIRKKCFEIVKILIKSGANVNAIGVDGNTPLSVALIYRYEETINIVKLLLSNGAQMQDYNIFQSLNSLQIFQFFVAEGANINTILKDRIVHPFKGPDVGGTILHVAARHGKYSLVKFLIENGADIEARNKENLTPLQFTLYSKHPLSTYSISRTEELNGRKTKVKMATLLIKQGAEVNVKDSKQKTPLHFVVSKDKNWCLELVDILLSKGANVNAEDCQKRTPLHVLVNDSY